MNITIFIIFLAIEIVCAVIMQSVAKKRQTSERLWFIVGLILGPFAFIFIPFIKNKNQP